MQRIVRTLPIFTLLGALLFATAAQGQKVVRDDYESLQVEFTTGTLKTGLTSLDGQTFSTLSIEGCIASSEVGAPCLPTYSRLVEVPLCDSWEVSVADAVYDTLDGTRLGLLHPLLPLQPSRSKSDTLRHPLTIGSAYGTDAYCGAPLALLEDAGIARDRRLARLQFSPVSYNPVSGSLVVCRQATVTVRYRKADREGTLALFERYHTPAFASGAQVLNSLYPKSVNTDAPVRYLIVAHSMFRGQLDGFVQWKRRKGFLTDIVYTDSAAVGTTTTSIQSFLQSQYTNATSACPAPTYVLLVGDHEQIPAFTGTTSSEHITDLYYISWTSGDNLPDCYCGRFSAQTIAQLTPQVDKTLMYEQYSFADPSFLDRAVMVAGVDGGNSGDYGYTHADPAMDYAIQHYINGGQGFSQVRYFKNNTSVVPTGSNVVVDGNSSSMSATVRSYYNQGAGLINYSAHGSATSWATPNFTTSHAAAMTNTQKFGLMIGNCCLTNKFQTTTCLGESVLRKGNYCGAVGYIGGSNSTYWGEDFYWAVGLRSSISASMSLAYNALNLGAYDRLCHTHGEVRSKWVTTQGELMFQGNMAVQGSTSSLKLYYWEVYHLMGDPSVMPYLTQADEMTVSVVPIVPFGSGSLTVNAAPYAYVALTDSASHSLVAAAFADAAGTATLTLPADLQPGSYELAASAQQYRTAFRTVSVILPMGTIAYTTAIATGHTLDAGAAVPLSLTVVNPGDSTAHGVVLHLASDNSALTFSLDSLVVGDIAANDTLQADNLVQALVGVTAGDGETATINVTTTWVGCQQPLTISFPFTLQAPVLTLDIADDALCLLPGNSGVASATLTNSGHADLPLSSFTLTSPTLLLDAAATDTGTLTLPTGSAVTRTFTLTVDAAAPQNALIPMRIRVANALHTTDSALYLFTGTSATETFEGGSHHTDGWTQGSNPWTFDAATAHGGSYSLRSTSSLSHSQTAMVTVARTYPTSDSISFYYKVSSEENYDKFRFYIDGVEMLSNSGEVEWTRAAYAVGAGAHTFKFSYVKDYSVSNGSDCAWIDDVVFPSPVQAVTFRGDTLCTGDTYVLFGDTIDTQQPVRAMRQGVEGGTPTVVDYLVLPATFSVDSVEACDSYLWEGTLYEGDTTLTQLLANTYGCDSTVTLVLTLHHPVYDTIADTAAAVSYQWNNSIYTVSGEYTQVLTAANGCDSTVTLLLVLTDPVGIDGTELPTLRVGPNPSNGTVRLGRQVDMAELYDALGRRVALLHGVSEVDLGPLPSGIYTLRVATRQGYATLRLVRL